MRMRAKRAALPRICLAPVPHSAPAWRYATQDCTRGAEPGNVSPFCWFVSGSVEGPSMNDTSPPRPASSRASLLGLLLLAAVALVAAAALWGNEDRGTNTLAADRAT